MSYVASVAVNTKKDIVRKTIKIIDVIYKDKKLHFNTPLVLVPKLNIDEELYTVSNEKLGIQAFAYSFDELVKEVETEIIFLWEEYALADDESLTNDARELKNNLLNAIKEL
ncbi:MAG: hypothetical protein ACTTKH_04415 [Treponema sp.]